MPPTVKDAPTTAKTMSLRVVYHQVSSNVSQVSPGHWAGEWRNRGICLDNVGQKDEEGGVQEASGTFDGVFASSTTTTSCVVKGKASCTFPDGSSRVVEYTEDCRPGPNGLLIFEGRGAFVDGSGRFNGIQGSMSWTDRNLTGPGPGEMGYGAGTATFTLPEK